MPAPVYPLAAVGLGLVFAWSGVAKVFRFSRWRAALDGYGLSGVGPTLALAVPVVELAVPALMLSAHSRAGAALALGLLALFSATILRARAARGDRLPCGCFGGADERDYRLMLARNATLGLLAAVVLARGRDLQPLEGLGAPDAADIVPVILVVVGAVMIAWLLRVALSGAQDDTQPTHKEPH